MAEQSKLVQTVMDAAAGIGWVGKKVLKETFINDPSTNFVNYGKLEATLSASIYLKDYMKDRKVIPYGM